jgi:Flp pilus assembly protein TadD
MGRLEEAVPHYREALRLKPDFVLAYNNLGLALQRTGRFEEAITNFKEALRLRPNNADINANLTRASGMLKKN